MRYTLKQLRYLVAVAEYKSVSIAAQSLFISQPAISIAIAQLEDMFDCPLIVRHHSKGISMTPAGHELVTAARGLLLHADELVSQSHEFNSATKGVLEVGSFVTIAPFFLPGLISSFSNQCSTIKINTREGDIDTLSASIVNGELELALVYDIDLDERIETEIIAEYRPYIIVSAQHRFAKRKIVSLATLADEPMVLLNLPHSRDYFRSLFHDLGIEPKIAHKTQSFEMVRGLVAHGIGYSILNLQPSVNKTYDGSDIVNLTIKEKISPLRIAIAYHRGGRLTRRAQTFAQHCRDYFSSN